MERDFAKDALRFLTCGSVDDGKSTLIGRILYESQKILDDQMLGLERDSQRFGTTGDEIDLALLTDGLEDERQQGITIDVGYRYFATAKRAFIVADTPGHEQYTRNVATGASNCELSVLLVDARKGLLRQTKRHATICSLLGIRHVVLAVNKIDIVGYDQQLFEQILAAFVAFAGPLQFRSIVGVPISARYGDNVIGLSENTPWYKGQSLLSLLETVDVRGERIERSARLSVQMVCRPNSEFRGYAGTLTSGVLKVGEPVIVAASGVSSTISRIISPSGDVPSASAGDAITVTLAEELDISRGDVICPAQAAAPVADQFRAHLVWLAPEPMYPGRQYVMRIGMRHVLASVTAIRYKLDVETLAREPASGLDLNEIAECNISLASSVEFEPYQENPAMGGFILIDRATNATVGMGMIKYALRRSSNIRPQRLSVDKQSRAAIKFQKPVVLWFTGLSGSGKSTIADLVERRLHEKGFHTYQLDGDNVRHGLNRDLGFTEADRVENIRRIGEVARLMTEAGLIVLCSFISPFRTDRQMVREKLSPGEFLEIFVDTPLEHCIARDPKGLYARALKGEIKNFTGVDSPYEPPQSPDLHLDTSKQDAGQLATVVLDALEKRGVVRGGGTS